MSSLSPGIEWPKGRSWVSADKAWALTVLNSWLSLGLFPLVWPSKNFDQGFPPFNLRHYRLWFHIPTWAFLLSGCVSVCAQSLRLDWLFANLWTVALQGPQYMGFSRQEYWSRLPCPPPKDLPNSGIEPSSPMSPAFRQIVYCWATGEALSSG